MADISFPKGFIHSLRVRWAEVDRQDVVFNGHYLTYFDVAVTEYWRALSLAHPSMKEAIETYLINLYVVKATVEYQAPAHYDDQLQIVVSIDRMGRSSTVLGLVIMRGDERLTAGELVYVYKEPGGVSSAAIPEDIRAIVERFNASLFSPRPL